jgi:DNA repair photolyase
MSFPLPIHGRGASHNPMNRFDRIDVVPDDTADVAPDGDDAIEPAPRTAYLRDTSRSIITTNDSPDVGFTHSINPYRGCEHGCIYCYARPTHEWLGFSAGLDFETRILVKVDAPELLRKELASPRWRPTTLSISGVTDCYQPVERRLRLTRQCLEVCAAFRNPIAIVTKNHLVTRDVDVLADLARDSAALVMISVTTLDADLARKMEPRTSAPARRLAALEALTGAGVPTGVMVAPVVPGLTDHELPAILKAARDAGASACGYVPLRLPFAVKDLFEQWLAQHFPDRADKVLNRVRSIRGGKLNDSNFDTRMRGDGPFAEQIRGMFELGKRRAGYPERGPELSTAAFRRPPDRDQPTLFD